MSKLHHVSLLTKDAKKNIAFYTQVLGFRFVKNTVNQENIHMRHLFYGDYLGTPGTVTTFFEVPNIGHRYDGKSYLNGIHYAIPEASLSFWYDRLNHYHIMTTQVDDNLQFNDPDGVTITLHPSFKALAPQQYVSNNIPGNYQIVGLLGTELHVPEIAPTLDFFERFLNLHFEDDQLLLDDGNFLKIMFSNSTDKHRFGRGSMDHVALTVTDIKSLQAMIQKAQDQGWSIEEVRDRGWFTSLYIREPNHNRIEFATMTPGFTLDEPLATLGESLGLPPKFESKRSEIEAYFKQRSVVFNG
ncbi:VOC family protein [Agrilactobacillus fermenti]|uniref:VOC family protein n=1 Tax=Agrilactobacillus fermenti TaxID=2586909 RepID=UPI001E3D4DC1|nr:VOC family protein [Agrilactobacillus fermenti]MCD2256671.1 VOC family protein [Agrilactobacillus fermenti]